MDAQLVVDNVTKAYGGVVAVAEVSLSVAKGEHVAIIGPNGAGKSTLFGVIAGEHLPTKGRVRFEDEDITSDTPSLRARKHISRTFQVARMFASATVYENVLLGAMTARGRGTRFTDRFHQNLDLAEDVERSLERTGLLEAADYKAETLNQGDRKRLELAMALVQDPKVLLLDEPTAGMSYQAAIETVQLLKQVCADEPDLTVILTAHDMEVIFALAQRVLLMAQGRTEVEGTPDEVAAHPKTREVYLGTKL